ncbi:hypothetical protein SUGI_0849790 [Cryptomeria japonica]|nr:hypothetical protein SUGI_0849790 [Cryptomeria japonica]
MLQVWAAKCMPVCSCIEDFQSNKRKGTFSLKSPVKDSSIILFQLHELATPIHGETSKGKSSNDGMQDAYVGHDHYDYTSSKTTEFVHFGTTTLNQLVDGWIEKAKKANLIAQQAKFPRQQIWDTRHSIVDAEQEPSNTEIFVDIDNIISGHNDSIDDTISGPATHETILGVGDDIYIANLMLAPNSCDCTATYWLAFEPNDMGCLETVSHG